MIAATRIQDPDKLILALILEDSRYNSNQIILSWNLKTEQQVTILEVNNVAKLITLKGINPTSNHILDIEKNELYNLRTNQRTILQAEGKQFDRKGLLDNSWRCNIPLVLENETCIMFSTSDQNDQKQACCFYTYNRAKLLYFQEIIKKLQTNKLEAPDIIVNQFTCVLPEPLGFPLRIFDGNNKQILSLLFNKIKSNNSSSDQMKIDLEIFIQMIVPGSDDISGLDLCIKDNNIKSIDIIFQALSLLPNSNLAEYILPKHFRTLSNLQLTSFEQYLSTCQFQHSFFKDPQLLKWSSDEDIVYYAGPTSILTQEYVDYLGQKPSTSTNIQKSIIRDKVINGIPNNPHVQSQPEDGPVNNHDSQIMNSNNKLVEDSDQIPVSSKGVSNTFAVKNKINPSAETNQVSIQNENKQKENEEQQRKSDKADSEKKTIEIYALEFTWIFTGELGRQFMFDLTQIYNERIFKTDPIKWSIAFLWSKFRVIILKKIFFPYLIYLASFITFATYGSKVGLALSDDSDNLPWYVIQFILTAFIVVGMLYQVLREAQQIKILKWSYFQILWNYFDLTSFTLNAAYIISYYCQADINKLRILASMAILMSWMKLFDFLRFFTSTAAFIRMISSILNDMKVFSLFLLLSFFTIGNSFYVLSRRFIHDESNSVFLDDSNNYGDALMFGYGFAIGNLNTNGFEDNEYAWILWVLFILSSFMVSIVFMNLLISIMGDTYDKVTSQMEVSQLKEVCNIIYEYEYLFDRETIFQKSKYIMVARVQSSEQKDDQEWVGKITSLKSHFKAQINEVNKKIQEVQKKVDEGNKKTQGVEKKVDELNKKLDEITKLLLEMKK